ncbi:uncharacterized protein [Ptychodera flava]|uniref:uncharacterized protein n=1 Tax=Ptychodera flava TaxID=63121 RepID=UPI00396A4EFE
MASTRRVCRGIANKVVFAILCILSAYLLSKFLAIVKRGMLISTSDDVIFTEYSLERNFSNITVPARRLYEKNGFVSLQFLNLGYVNITKSWICNVECLGILPRVLFITTDEEAHRSLSEWKPELNVVLEKFGDGKAMAYGKVSYYRYGLFRVQVINRLLRKERIPVFETEADSYWLGDPVAYFNRYTDFDMIIMHNGCADMIPSGVINGGFLYLNATAGTLRVWNKLSRRIASVLARYDDKEKDIGIEGSEQIILGKILQSDRLKLQWLPIEKFTSGYWYMQAEVRKKADPIVILNNYINGNGEKVKRAKRWGHWSLSEEGDICIAEACRTAL